MHGTVHYEGQNDDFAPKKRLFQTSWPCQSLENEETVVHESLTSAKFSLRNAQFDADSLGAFRVSCRDH